MPQLKMQMWVSTQLSCITNQCDCFSTFYRVALFFEQRSAVFVGGYEILSVLYLYHISRFSGIGTQNNGAIQSGQYAFAWISGNICTVVLLFSIKGG